MYIVSERRKYATASRNAQEISKDSYVTHPGVPLIDENIRGDIDFLQYNANFVEKCISPPRYAQRCCCNEEKTIRV